MCLSRITNWRSVALITVLFAAFALSGCADREDRLKRAEGKTVVVATILPLADWAAQIGGDRVYVSTLLPAGASPHTFDPTPRDMRIISHARLFLKVGLQMDDWGASLVRSAGANRPDVVSLGDVLYDQAKLPDVSNLVLGPTVEPELEESDHHNHHTHGSVNPHFWLDPHLAMESVSIIRDALIQVDPEGQAYYSANAQSYMEKLRQLDVEFSRVLEPFKGSRFVSFHNAWPYLARRYHLKIAAVIEEFAGKTPSENYLRSVTDLLKKLKIRTVFTEPQLNPRVADLIAGEIGGSVSLLDPYGTEGESNRNTYLKVMHFNLQQLVSAFSIDGGKR